MTKDDKTDKINNSIFEVARRCFKYNVKFK